MAADLFEDVMKADRTRMQNETVLSPDELLLAPGNKTRSDSVGNMMNHPFYGITEIEDSVYSIAANNYAICCLHLRRIREAISTIEVLLQSDPPRHAIDPIIFNICTMYDLSCAPDTSTAKKKALQEVMATYHVDDLHWRSFRLN